MYNNKQLPFLAISYKKWELQSPTGAMSRNMANNIGKIKKQQMQKIAVEQSSNKSKQYFQGDHKSIAIYQN